jgi:carnosine synthase
VDTFRALPEVYRLVREVVTLEKEPIFRAGFDLLLEQYLDGVEFDIDLVLEDGESVFSSVSENWPTAERTFQETGLHCPPDQSPRAIRELVGFCIEAVQAVGFRTGVLHIEAKTTRNGPRIVEINARMGGGRVPEIVAAVWNVDLVEAQLRAALGLAQTVRPSRRPRCAVVDQIVYAPESGRLTALPFVEVLGYGDLGVKLDIHADVGDEVDGPETAYASALAEVAVAGRDLRHARSLMAEVLRHPPQVEVGIGANTG